MEHDFNDWQVELNSKNVCKGYYRVPATPVKLTNDLYDLPIHIHADNSYYNLNGLSSFSGDVSFIQGSRQLLADEVNLTQTPNGMIKTLNAQGHLHYISPGLHILANNAWYDHREKNFLLEGTQYRWYERHGRGKAQSINIDDHFTLHLTNATYTTCAPHENTWELIAGELTLYPKRGRATVKNVRLNIGNQPIFYFPYFNYPIDKKRHTGFLTPRYGSTANSGIELTFPFYWNIAPNYDLTVSPRFLTERGGAVQSKFRYLWPHSEGTLQWYVLPHDRKYENFVRTTKENLPGGLDPNDPRIKSLHDAQRHAVNYEHISQLDKHWQSHILFAYVSDDNYFVDLGDDINVMSTVHLPQQANLTYYGEHWSHFFNVEEYQVLQPLSKPVNQEIYRRQPQWAFQAVYPNTLFHSTLGLNGEIVNFAHRADLITQLPLITGQRLHLRPSISFPMQKSEYFITPRMQLDWLNYKLNLKHNLNSMYHERNIQRTIPLYDIDAGLFLERDIRYRQYHFVQTLEPRIYYLYVPYRAQDTFPNFDSGIINFSYSQLFRDNRFSGRDRVGDANQLTTSISSRLYPKGLGVEWLRMSVGQILYFRPRRVSLENIPFEILEDTTSNNSHIHHSHLIAEANMYVNHHWSSGAFWEWDNVHRKTEQASFHVQFHPSINKILNFNYYWQRQDLAQINLQTGALGSLHQADISWLWPLNPKWQLLARWHYDLKQEHTLEILGGVEYNACCIAVQIIGSRYRQASNTFIPNMYATGIFAQVVLKGFSSLPINNPDEEIKKRVPGYTSLLKRQGWSAIPH